MAELTIEQKRAVAMAKARLRLGTSTPAADPNQVIIDRQKAQFPTSAEMGGKPGAMVQPETRSLGPMGLIPHTMDQLRGQFAGRVKPIASGLANFAYEADANPVGAIYDAAKGLLGTPGRVKDAGSKFVSGATMGDSQQMAEGTAGFIEEIPNMLGIKAGVQAGTRASAPVTRGALKTVTTPENLQLRAATNRAPHPTQNWLTHVGENAVVAASGAAVAGPFGSGAAVTLNLLRKSNGFRALKATSQERLAKWIAKGDKPKDFSLTPAETAALREAKEGMAATEARNAQAHKDYMSGRTYENAEYQQGIRAKAEAVGQRKPVDGPKVGGEHPSNKVDPELAEWRDVENYDNFYDIDAETKPAVTRGEDLPVTDKVTTVSEAVTKFNLARAARNMAAKGDRASKSVGRNIKRYVEVVPELKTATPEATPGLLLKAHERVGEAVGKAEMDVPRETTVPRQSLVEGTMNAKGEMTGGIRQLIADYKAKNAPWAEAAAAKLETVRALWDALPEQIQWETFRDMKRAFFQDSKTGPTHMKRAYGQLMEASSRVSTDLAKANGDYSTIMRMLDDAKVDPYGQAVFESGGRISDVSKPVKAPGLGAGPAASGGIPPPSAYPLAAPTIGEMQTRGSAPALGTTAAKGTRIERVGDGDVIAIVTPDGPVGSIHTKTRGNAVHVSSTVVYDRYKGKGVGSEAYSQLADQILSEGKEMWSDSNVSQEGARLYESLGRKGYTVEKNPGAWTNESGMWMAGDEPVFKVTKAPPRPTSEGATIVRGTDKVPEAAKTPSDPGYVVQTGPHKGYVYEGVKTSEITGNKVFTYRKPGVEKPYLPNERIKWR